MTLLVSQKPRSALSGVHPWNTSLIQGTKPHILPSLLTPEISKDVTACLRRKTTTIVLAISAEPGGTIDGDRWIWIYVQ